MAGRVCSPGFPWSELRTTQVYVSGTVLRSSQQLPRTRPRSGVVRMVAHTHEAYEESENDAGDLASGRIQGDVRAYLNTEQKRRRRRGAIVAAGMVVGYIATAAAYFCLSNYRFLDSRLRRLEWGQRLEHDDAHSCIRTRWSKRDWCGHRRGRGGDSGGSGYKKEGHDRESGNSIGGGKGRRRRNYSRSCVELLQTLALVVETKPVEQAAWNLTPGHFDRVHERLAAVSNRGGRLGHYVDE